MPIEIREIPIKVVVKAEAASTAMGSSGDDGSDAQQSGTGKTLAASLLGRDAADDDGPGLVAAETSVSEGASHGVTVLAWARVDGTSASVDSFSWGTAASREAGSGLVKAGPGTLVLSGSHAAGGSGDDLLVGGTTVHDLAYEPNFRGGITVAVGDVGSGDDVVVDGRIITGEMTRLGDGSLRFVADTADLF